MIDKTKKITLLDLADKLIAELDQVDKNLQNKAIELKTEIEPIQVFLEGTEETEEVTEAKSKKK